MSMHSKTKKYATDGKKTKSRVVEVDAGSGRSTFHSQASWTSSAPFSAVSTLDKENSSSSQSLGTSPRPKASITHPSTQAQRNQKAPFSAALLARYALARPVPPTPRSPLSKGRRQRQKATRTEEGSSDDNFEDEVEVVDVKSKVKDVRNIATSPSSKPVSRAAVKQKVQDAPEEATHASVSVQDSLTEDDGQPESSVQATPTASPAKAPVKIEFSPKRFTPFEIVPPTPSIIKVTRNAKTHSPAVKKRSAAPPAALRVRPVNASAPSHKNVPGPRGKSIRQDGGPPAAPSKPAFPDIVVLDSESDSEVEVVQRRSKNEAKPPKPAKTTAIKSKKQREDATCEEDLDSKPSTNPFKADDEGPTLVVKPPSAGSSTSTVPQLGGPVPSPFKHLTTPAVPPPQTPAPSALRKSSLKVTPAIESLLHACGQKQAYDFTSFTQHTSFLTPSSIQSEEHKMAWRKLGEATYSEIFVRVRSDLPKSQQLQDESSMVVKVVPIHLPKPVRRRGKKIVEDEEDKPEETSVQDALRELTVTRLMNEDDPGGSFISLLGGHVVQGTYPPEYLDQWRAYKKAEPQKALNLCPDAFEATQYYLVLCLPYGGLDLETFRLHSWTHAASILWQTAYGLATAERSWHFEHRDLHWGNVLIKQCPPADSHLHTEPTSIPRSPQRKSVDRKQQAWPACLEPEAAGIKICIIDYSLSSCDDGAGSRLHGGLEDEVVFEGQGDYQFDIYRMMREATGAKWENFHPVTNLMWLHYLVGRLLRHKGLKVPTPTVAASRKPAPGFGVYKRHTGLLSGYRTQEDSSASDAERQAYNALVLAEQALFNAIRPDGCRDTALSGAALGLGEVKDSDSFLTWLSVAPELA